MKRERLDGRAAVLTTLSRCGPLSRAELARQALLAPSTVSGLIADLTEDGLLVELQDKAPTGSRGGRPATLLTLHPDTGVVVGVDIGKTHMRVALADLSHRVIGERSRSVAADATARSHVSLARKLADELLAEAGIASDRIVGLGCGFPGPVQTRWQSIDATILPGWVGVNPVEKFTKAFGVPVEIGNDANLGALSEWMWGAGRGSSDVAYLKVATGIGAGLILRGGPFVGHGGTAGEIGHVSLDPAGPQCRCGNRGCLELMAGSKAIVARVGKGATLESVLSGARAGEADCVEAIAASGTLIGRALAAVCNLLNPQRIVIGGEVAAAGDLLLDPLRASLEAVVLGTARADLEVVLGDHGERAEVLGAVAQSLRNVTPLTS